MEPEVQQQRLETMRLRPLAFPFPKFYWVAVEPDYVLSTYVLKTLCKFLDRTQFISRE